MASAPILLRLFDLSGMHLETLADLARRDMQPAELPEFAMIGDRGIRHRRIVRRALARRFLGALLGLAPVAVEITRGPHGKPRLPCALAFNISARDNLIAIACARDAPLGVDIEVPQPHLADGIEPLLAQWMTPPLRQTFGANAAAPFQAWTAVEAIRKAGGEGIGQGDFRLHPFSQVPEVVLETSGADRRLWQLYRFVLPRAPSPARPIVGSLAWPHAPHAAPREIDCRQFSADATLAYLSVWPAADRWAAAEA